jgi:glycine cleavage system aminomethyltransferase T
VSKEAWPFLRARPMEVAHTHAWAFRVSFTGELGWELLVPTEFVADLYEHIVAAGADLGLRQAGSAAFDVARQERGFRSWGHDIGPLDEPFSSGLGFTVARRKGPDFVGREALERLRGTAPERRLVSVLTDRVLWHGESMLRDGERVGHVTSAAIAPSLDGFAGLAWIHGPVDGDWCVEIGGEPAPVRVSVDPFYDPRGERLRS